VSDYAKILSLSYDNAIAEKTFALKSYFRSVRLIKISGILTPDQPSYITNVLLCGNCIDPEKRCLYVFYIDTYLYTNPSTGDTYNSAWIIEINIDTRAQTVVYYDKYNAIGFNPKYKIYNARVVHGRIVWTDNLNAIYQMDVERAKRSFYYGIGYGQYPITEEWSAVKAGGYGIGQIVSRGNYFYKSVIDYNSGNDPWSGDVTLWETLCVIEDAYYSLDIRNFYFEAMPPKHPPVVIYQSDNTRKINNLRQTLFQIAYRYVYMDWRKSTFSPASIVPVPQAEEEAATGLANEQISLNNQLQITFNSGTEEVRAIEIIGRSSQDVSKWFLIDTIEKFKVQEKGSEVSSIVMPAVVGLGLTIPVAIVSSSTNPNPDGQASLGMGVLFPTVLNIWLFTNESSLSFAYSDGTASDFEESIIHMSANLEPFTVDMSAASWAEYDVYAADGVTKITNQPEVWGEGCSVHVFPINANGGGARTGTVYINAIGAPPVPIAISQQGVPATVNVIAGNDLVMTISAGAGHVTGGLIIQFTPHYVPNNDPQFDVCWLIRVNGNDVYSSAAVGLACTQDVHKNSTSIAYGSATWNDGDAIDVLLYYELAPNLS